MKKQGGPSHTRNKYKMGTEMPSVLWVGEGHRPALSVPVANAGRETPSVTQLQETRRLTANTAQENATSSWC